MDIYRPGYCAAQCCFCSYSLLGIKMTANVVLLNHLSIKSIPGKCSVYSQLDSSTPNEKRKNPLKSTSNVIRAVKATVDLADTVTPS